jgi:hypothetical protein
LGCDSVLSVLQYIFRDVFFAFEEGLSAIHAKYFCVISIILKQKEQMFGKYLAKVGGV